MIPVAMQPNFTESELYVSAISFFWFWYNFRTNSQRQTKLMSICYWKPSERIMVMVVYQLSEENRWKQWNSKTFRRSAIFSAFWIQLLRTDCSQTTTLMSSLFLHRLSPLDSFLSEFSNEQLETVNYLKTSSLNLIWLVRSAKALK